MNNEMGRKQFQMSPAQKQQTVQTLKKILSPRKEIKFAFIYGSFNEYTGEENLPFHDIDVGVHVSDMKEKESVYYALDLSEHLSSSIKVPVEVHVLNFAPVTFLYHVIRGQLIIDNDEDARCEFMERVIRHYLDMKPLLSRSIKEAFAS